MLSTGIPTYKIKKVIRLGFLDFVCFATASVLCKRNCASMKSLRPRFTCDIIAIAGSIERGGGGRDPVLDYAVKMREFPREALLLDV